MTSEVICALIAAAATVVAALAEHRSRQSAKRSEIRAARREKESRLAMDLMYANCSLSLLPPCDEDGAGPQETYSTDGLGTKAADIYLSSNLCGHVRPTGGNHHKQILAQNTRQGGSEAHQHIGPKPRSPSLAAPLKANRASQQHGQQQTQRQREDI